MIELKEKHLNSFFEAPFKVYPPSFPYVSHLKTDLARFLSIQNPLFRSEKDFNFFTAIRDNQIVGRIVCHIHQASNEKYNLKRAYFGFFDCVDDVEVAKTLLQKAEEFALSRDCNEIAGNFNLTAMQQIGVVKKIHRNFHYMDQVFAPEYISTLLEACGYQDFFPIITHEVDIQKFDVDSLLGDKQKQIMANPDFQLKNLKNVSLDEIIEAMRICLNNGFNDNPMFVPLTREEIYFQAKDMMLILDKEISVIAEYQGKPIGALVCLPNLNPFLKNIKSRFGLSTPYYFLKQRFEKESAIIIYYSVFKEFHSMGLNGVMLHKAMSALKKGGYKTLGGTWISLDNKASIRQAEKLGAQTMHELCLYRKFL